MTIGEYISSFQFDKIKLFKKKKNQPSFRVYKQGTHFNYLENEEAGTSDPRMDEFEEIFETKNIDKIHSIVSHEKNPYLVGAGHDEITSIIEFWKEEIFVAKMYCNFLMNQFLSSDYIQLHYDPETLSIFHFWAKKEGASVGNFISRHNEIGKGRFFEYPNSFVYNHVHNVFETRIDINLNSINSKRWVLDIDAIADRPTIKQINLINLFIKRSRDIRKEILDGQYNYYQTTARFDFELPELSDQEQLLYFFNSGRICLTEDGQSLFSISFSNWDEEHGAFYYYDIDKDKLMVQ